ncbi:hypothetical protein V495_05383 [Pseudogymnoascus sp. VKM F-4514 (FW-929)]|nr:hypothetical protein V495_05383 [Pseudogymnoascus sp. VKM F-4514 (FW-929)]KFY56757.1 hypothetical protein V497_05969 [Pseudogymnoascus sp. VKM F-4516 (FW-969)]
MAPKKDQTFSVISWYSGQMTSEKGLVFRSVINFSDDELENRHDFIHLLFPLQYMSGGTTYSYKATKRQFSTIGGPGPSGQSFRRHMLEAVKRILAMFDLELTPVKECTPHGSGEPTDKHRHGGRRIRKIKPVEGDGIDHEARAKRLKSVADPNSHHHRRITRMIRSLQLCRRGPDSESIYRFFRRFAREHRMIPRRTLRLWGVAHHSIAAHKDPNEDIRDTTAFNTMGEPSLGDAEVPESQSSDGSWGISSHKTSVVGNEPPRPPKTISIASSSEKGLSSASSSEKGLSEGGDGPDDGGLGGAGGSGGDSPDGSASSDSSDGPDDPDVPKGPDDELSKKIGDEQISDEDVEKLTPAQKELHHARLQHRREYRDIEIGLEFRDTDGEWIGGDPDPSTVDLLELRVWQTVVQDEERRRRRVQEGKAPSDSSSSDGSDHNDPDDEKEFERTDVVGFGEDNISDENFQKLEAWEKKLHLAIVEHTKDYKNIEIKHRLRDAYTFLWKSRRPAPVRMNMKELRAWKRELDDRERDWLKEVTEGQRGWTQALSTKSSEKSEFVVGDPNMSIRFYERLYEEEQSRHLRLIEYDQRFGALEYELNFRDRATSEWKYVGMQPFDMSHDELDTWFEDMEEFEAEYNERVLNEAAAQNSAPPRLTPVNRRQRSPSPDGIEAAELMAEGVRRGLGPYGTSPEAIKWKAAAEEIERKKAAAKAAAEEESNEDPGNQLLAEQRQSQAKRPNSSNKSARSSGEAEDSSRSKRRRIG